MKKKMIKYDFPHNIFQRRKIIGVNVITRERNELPEMSEEELNYERKI